MMNIQNVLLWFECRHGDIYATDQCHRQYNALFHSNSHINQIPPQIVSHPVLFLVEQICPDFIMKYILSRSVQ